MESIDLICFRCKWFGDTEDGGGCKAFPDGIPNIILSGDNLHKKPLKEQDNNIVFEPLKQD